MCWYINKHTHTHVFWVSTENTGEGLKGKLIRKLSYTEIVSEGRKKDAMAWAINACLYVSNHTWPLPENSLWHRHIGEDMCSKDHEKAIVQKFQTWISLQRYTQGPLNVSISVSAIGRMSQRVESRLIGKSLYFCSYYLSVSCALLYLTAFGAWAREISCVFNSIIKPATSKLLRPSALGLLSPSKYLSDPAAGEV